MCGITPYDATHIGHAATYLAYDTLIRVWLDAGYDVRYVQNTTDVDDPLLERAAATGVDWRTYKERPRLCDLGYLRRAYRRADGRLDYRCPSEPVNDYVRKGGRAEDTVGRKCLCNALVTNIGMGQRQANGYEELPMLTAGVDIDCVRAYITPDRLSYRARDVVESLLPSA